MSRRPPIPQGRRREALKWLWAPAAFIPERRPAPSVPSYIRLLRTHLCVQMLQTLRSKLEGEMHEGASTGPRDSQA